MSEPTLLNDRYQLLEKLGSGGMADVFRARDLMLDRIVAIKVLQKDYSNNPDFQNYFRLEARAAANLSHPNIVTVHDFGFADNLLFIVMEFIPGKDLKQLIRERGRFSVEAGIPLIIQACAGLGYAHRAGLVHCDVKPSQSDRFRHCPRACHHHTRRTHGCRLGFAAVFLPRTSTGRTAFTRIRCVFSRCRHV
jgi:hypothetical protein